MRCLTPTTFALILLLVANMASAAPPAVRHLDLPGQAQGSVLATRDGFLLSWIDREADHAAMRFAELDRDGAILRRGEVARGSGWFINWADFPSLVIADNGDWLGFVLVKSDPSKPYAYDIHTTRSTDRGVTWSPLSVLHDDGTTTEHGFVSLLPDGNDRILAVWLDGRHTRSEGGHDGHDHGGAHTALHTAVLTRNGIIERQELDDLTCDCCRTALARGPEGPVAVYRDRTRDEIRDIFAVTRDAQGWSEPKPLPADQWKMPGCPVNGPALVPQGEGLLAAWPTQIDGMPMLRLARLNRDTWQALPELDRGNDMLGRVDLAPWAGDTTLAVWLGTEGERSALKLAELDANGAALTTHTIDTLPSGRATGMPRIAAHDGRALVVWTLPGEHGSLLRGALISH